MVNAPQWQFRRFSPGDNLSDPEFTKALFSGDNEASLTRSLIREAIQNSLDAKRKDADEVSVRIGLWRNDNSARASSIAPFLTGIWDHIGADSSGLAHSGVSRSHIPYLTIEDFGTHGLRGDPEHWKPTGIARNAFFLFFRALGRSGKEGEERGRWGVGKFVFPMAGQAHAMWGLSVPSDSRHPLLMGRVVLKTHQVGEHSYHPDGHYGHRKNPDSNLVSPVRDSHLIQEFSSAFQLKRRTEPGLSVVVPWVLNEITTHDIRRAVVGEYFMPLLRRQLTVTVSDGNEEVTLDDSTVVRFAEETKDPILKARLTLACALTSGSSHLVEWPTQFSYDDTEWATTSLPKDFLERLRGLLEEKVPLSVKVSTTVRKKEPDEVLHGTFDLHIQHVEGLGASRPLIIRDGISLTADKTRTLQDHVALVLVDNGPVATMLGDAETPAHEELKHNLIKDRYFFPRKTVVFVREAASQMLRLIWQSDQGDDPLLLSSFFPVLDDTGRIAARPATARRGKEPEPRPIIPRSPPRFRVSLIEGGFRVRPNPDVPARLAELTVAVAYDVRRGSPFKRYRTLDFDFKANNMQVHAEGCKVSISEGNRLFLRDVQDLFLLEVTGFDPNRDLVVRVVATEGAQ